MDQNLLQKLKDWRASTARKEGVELFRILPNKTLEAIAAIKPTTKETLLTVGGIKEKKFEKYGAEILSLVGGKSATAINTGLFAINPSFAPARTIEGKQDNTIEQPKTEEENEKARGVSDYLNLLNIKLREEKARVRGEISSLDIRGSYLFFSLKDTKDESVLSCFMWRNNYELCGIALEEGMEIIVEGYPEIYKPSGRLSFKASIVELVGEGALKKAYDKLKKKLEEENLFAPERKKLIPEFPQKIGLITSEKGAVIYDFLNNLGRHGYQIEFMDSRVEGQTAVRDLIKSIDYFNDKDIDVLVIIRGGGSLESLQAFNNETLARKIAAFKIPIICGIGHDKDVPLASLAADEAVSTPTAVTVILNKSWGNALNDIAILEKDLIYKYQESLGRIKYDLETLSNKLEKEFGAIFQKFEELKHRLKNALMEISYEIRNIKKTLSTFADFLLSSLKRGLEKNNNALGEIEKQLKIFDPTRQLKLGYSIVSTAGKIVKSVRQVSEGEKLDIQVSDGKINTKVEKIIK